MLPFTNMALQKKISLFVLAGLAVALGLFSFLSVKSLNESTQRILDQRLAVARILASDIDKTMLHALTHLHSSTSKMDGFPTFDGFVTLVSPIREILADTGVSIQNFVLIDSEGKVKLVYQKNPDLIGADWSQLPEVKRSLETGQLAITNQLTEPQTKTQMILALAPILDGKGKITGILAAIVDPARSSMITVGQLIQAGNTGYIEIVDGNGLVIARTEPGVPLKLLEQSDHPGRFSDLIKEGKAIVRTCHRCHEVNQEIQRRRDIIAFAPLSAVPWGVAIRQSEDEALAPTRQLEMRLLSLGIILLMGAVLLVWLMVQGVVKPLKALKAAAQKVAVGDFEAAIPLERGDEIGELSRSFYTMTQELAKSRNQLVSRNKELTALNSISVAVSQSLDLKHLSETALKNVLEVTQTTSGCIFLPDSEGNRLERLISLGSSGVFSCEKSQRTAGDCACYQVLRNRQTLMVNDVLQCPMLDEDTSGETVTAFASIPLKSKDRVLGIMNVACSSERDFNESDFELFNSIGFQVGLALENSLLYSESKQKEELRGQLLSSIISAQEEERKRISRELHDESGQTLIAAIMKVESIENLVPAKESALREKIQGVKSMIARTLEDIRRLTHDLRPMALDDLGLASAMRTYVKNRLEAIGIQVQFESKGLSASRRLSPAIETALFRIIQEATNNIVKHADAHKVSIQLSIENETIRATIEDDGKGFEPDSVFSQGSSRQSLGLLGIKERVALLGGTFSIRSQRHQGTRMVVEIPAVYQPVPQEAKEDKREPKPVEPEEIIR